LVQHDAGTLRRGADGAMARNREVPSHATVSAHARALAEDGAAAHLDLERGDVVSAARARVSAAGWGVLIDRLSILKLMRFSAASRRHFARPCSSTPSGVRREIGR